ncbi:kinase-like domain-containing protein [Umbelopsis sp. PMI_123]|nr:kinase-like domain-containing protein [Umbelopsis sp. PMI_123]
MLMSSRTPRSRDEVAPRKPKRILEIGKPIEFEHGIHGLPDVWQGVIPSSDDLLDTSCISPHLVPAPCLIAHTTKADNISKPYNVQHNIHVQVDKTSYVLQGLPPAWAHQLQCSNQVPAHADFQTDHVSTRTRSSMNPHRSASSSSNKSLSSFPKSKSWTDIRRKASKTSVDRKTDECQDPLLLYKDIVEVAEGESGSLYSAMLISDPRTTVAIKRISLSDTSSIEKKKKEMQAMKQCRHPNIINYISHHWTNNELWIVMEYLNNCLTDIITVEDPDVSRSQLNEQQMAYIMRSVLLALKHMHSFGRIHRDVRADNILLNSEGLVKLADFGQSAQLTATAPNRKSLVGTPFWMAPEVIRGEDYDTAVDIWSLGALLYELLTGSPPLSEYPPLRAIYVIASKGLPVPPGKWSDELLDFFAQCTIMEASHRPTASNLLEHPFIVQHAGTSECLQDLFVEPPMNMFPIELSSSEVTTDEAAPSHIVADSINSKDTDTSTVATQTSSVWSWMDEPNALNMDFQIAIDFDHLQLSSTMES